MEYLFYITLIGLLTGVLGTVGGSLLVLMVKKANCHLLTLVLGISAGLMTIVVFLDLIPEAREVGNIGTTLFGMILGIILITAMDGLFPHTKFNNRNNGKLLKAGLLLAVGIALHNLPEGLAIGAGYQVDTALGFGLAVIIAAHNLPEGMAIATTLCLAGLRAWSIILISLLSGIPMGIGAFVGGYLGRVSDFTLSISLGFAAGAMIYITFDELIPGAHEKSNGKIAIAGILLGIFVGLIITDLI